MEVQLDCRKYNLALDNVEQLVVQRLFELTKLGMSGIGYKLREIGKALKSRAETIKKALEHYNALAAKLKPLREPLSWSQIVGMASLADFDLLRESREDIRWLPWAKPENRRAMNMHFNIKHAHEEIHRLNIEATCLFSAMVVEHYDFQMAIKCHAESDPALAAELEARWCLRDHINSKIAARLWQTSYLPGFSGNIVYGRRVGRQAGVTEEIPLPFWAGRPANSEVDSKSGDEAPEDTIPGMDSEQEARSFLDFVDTLGDT
ncbi:hypothetical protein CERSUDRAFT_54347 [Gelatoporia subvermispora B]|uniref:Uncharacterized protein n=1 Tax=Ceriporiopsis subvermispora (strain B) TaxID=914234 RepID=M2QSU4_CERS8|nr:hypothetical protein CERSUDRAFT_54347 [Gelatoporia subvermispora B]